MQQACAVLSTSEWVAEAPPAHSTQNGRHEKDARWVAVRERQQLSLGPIVDLSYSDAEQPWLSSVDESPSRRQAAMSF